MNNSTVYETHVGTYALCVLDDEYSDLMSKSPTLTTISRLHMNYR